MLQFQLSRTKKIKNKNTLCHHSRKRFFYACSLGSKIERFFLIFLANITYLSKESWPSGVLNSVWRINWQSDFQFSPKPQSREEILYFFFIFMYDPIARVKGYKGSLESGFSIGLYSDVDWRYYIDTSWISRRFPLKVMILWWVYKKLSIQLSISSFWFAFLAFFLLKKKK